MCKTQCLFFFAALSINLVSSWDIAVTTGDQLEFYTNKTITHYERASFRALTALAYDAVHNMLLFVDKQNDNASIFSYHLATKKYQSLVGRRSNEDIQGLDFDPVSGKLFWTDKNEKSIFWIQLWPERPKNDLYGNLLIKMDDEIPRGIVVDSCRGYIYWTNINQSKPTIEKARLDGSERKVIVQTDIHSPISLALDQRTKRLYWADDRAGIYYSIESSDLDGKNRKTLLHGTDHQPNTLTVSKDSIYWLDGYNTVWKINKNEEFSKPIEIVVFPESPFGIVANYSVEDQASGIPECENLNNLSLNKSSFNDSFNIREDVGLFCLHGDKVAEKYSTCKCFPGYTGIRCEISVCQNFCLNGDCSSTPEGNPTCKCKLGFSGVRCEIDVCNGHCLNNGECSLEGSNPVCRCVSDFEGERCETRIVETTTPLPHVSEPCNCSDIRNSSDAVVQGDSLLPDDGYVEVGCAGWDPLRDPALMLLGILCGLLLLTCAVLVTKILQLKKRPRIKKRIIVNKNVTPLTARPDQCEITIENCCNMNICETSEESQSTKKPISWISLRESIQGVFPCFEPRNTIRPTLLDSKPGKEEKRNLIANMENQDDLY